MGIEGEGQSSHPIGEATWNLTGWQESSTSSPLRVNEGDFSGWTTAYVGERESQCQSRV